MDSSSGQAFSVNAPFRQATVIFHFASLAMAILGCQPLALVSGARRHRRHQIFMAGAGCVFGLVGLMARLSQQPNESVSTVLVRFLLSGLGCSLAALLLVQLALVLYCYYMQQQYQHNQQSLPVWASDQSQLILGWFVLGLGYAYLVLAALVSTESCTLSASSAQCLMPLTMGSGFLLYGSFCLLHLINVFKLPRGSTPEYYEGLLLTVWGLACLTVADTPILGSDWRALNLGLLWTAGGIFSVAMSLQSWMPSLRERNIANALIMCLTGRAVIAGFTQNDPYAAQVHTMLGYVLLLGALTRTVQIIFRKSPVENLPQLMARASGTPLADEEEDDANDAYGRPGDYTATYRQLTGQSPPCKHQPIFASITLVSGLLTAFLAMACGILFMGANVQWMDHVRYYMTDPATYVNLTLALTFLWASYLFALCTVYKRLRPLSAAYYEYLGMAELETPLEASFEDREIAQRYEQQRDLRRTRSLPSRRGVEEPPPMRPSQYRAKRRSLLVQSPQQQQQQQQPHDYTKSRSRSSSGVGGVLPDAVADYTLRRSWLSNGSATSAGSVQSFASMNSSASSSLPLAANASQSPTSDAHRRTVLFSDEPAVLIEEDRPQEQHPDEYDDGSSVRKTESGRRKERHHDASPEASSSVAQYYSSERNSSDSHVC